MLNRFLVRVFAQFSLTAECLDTLIAKLCHEPSTFDVLLNEASRTAEQCKRFMNNQHQHKGSRNRDESGWGQDNTRGGRQMGEARDEARAFLLGAEESSRRRNRSSRHRDRDRSRSRSRTPRKQKGKGDGKGSKAKRPINELANYDPEKAESGACFTCGKTSMECDSWKKSKGRVRYPYFFQNSFFNVSQFLKKERSF